MSLLLVIMGDVQQKIEESKINAKKAERRKKEKEAGKIVEENENSNYDKKAIELRWNIYSLCELLRKKIDYKTQYSQQEKLQQLFGTCRFVYNKCVSWCRLASRKLTKDELRNKIYDHYFACIYLWFYTNDFWLKRYEDGE